MSSTILPLGNEGSKVRVRGGPRYIHRSRIIIKGSWLYHHVDETIKTLKGYLIIMDRSQPNYLEVSSRCNRLIRILVQVKELLKPEYGY